MSVAHILSLNDENLNREIYGEQYIQNKFLKDHEILDLISLVSNLRDKDVSFYQGFFIGYLIPHVEEEIDLLKVNEDSILNIELKSTSTLEKINRQQVKNAYYFESVDKTKVIITYVSQEEKFYILDDNNQSVEIKRDEVIEYLSIFSKKESMSNIDSLFDPSEFLISPFNNTERFLEDKYFLTDTQKEVKNKFLKYNYDLTIINGRPGTGKSLLLYDIAKKLLNTDYKVLLLHCAPLNGGHDLLNSKGWNIRSPHENWIRKEEYFKNIDYILIDESHRFRRDQLEYIIEYSKDNNIKIITSIDPGQYLHEKENSYDNLEYLKSLSDSVYEGKLGETIRSNYEIAEFIKTFFNLRYSTDLEFPSISVEYFNADDDINRYINNIEKQDWIFIPFTKSLDKISYHKYSNIKPNLNSHRVIGQEFDKVAVVLDKSFAYENGDLNYVGDYHYQPRQMLFQNLTRARRKIKLIIVDNLPLYRNILQIINMNTNFNPKNYNLNLPINEKETAEAFYDNVLGFKVMEKYNPKNGLGNIWFKVGPGKITLCEVEDFSPSHENVFPTIKMPDLEKLARDLEDYNIDFEVKNVRKKKRIKSIKCQDPFGNTLEFI